MTSRVMVGVKAGDYFGGSSEPESFQMTPESSAFLATTLRFQDVGTAEIAYRTYGEGPPLLCIHGWPLSGLTFRKMIPRLAQHFTCIVADSPGGGETRWKDDHDFSFTGQANSYARFVDALGLKSLSVLAHDTGATIARQLALTIGPRVEKLVLIGTELPGHRPPFIPMFQQASRLPGSTAVFRTLLRSQAFRESSMGLGGCFVDKRLIGGEFHEHFIAPLLASPRKMEGQLRYMRGVDWQLVDGLRERHREIEASVLLIWGEDDRIFPPALAAAMAPQFTDCRGFLQVPGAALFAHEEKPDAVTGHALGFLRAQA
jgi:haloalkane dehalogenase